MYRPRFTADLNHYASHVIHFNGTHAQAESTRVCVDVENGRAQLVIRDDSCGFPLKTTLNQPTNHDHFGLPGIQKRAQTLGGECHIFSQPGAGTSIVVDIPV